MLRLSEYSAAIQAIAALIQAATAIIIVWLTCRLAKATADYTKLTKDILDLTRQQDSRALLPNWHLSFVPSTDGTLGLKILNLSRNSARVTHLFIRVETEGETEARRFPLDLGMPAGSEQWKDIAACILEAVKPYIMHGDWAGNLEIGIVFQLAESPEPRPSAGFSFRAVVRGDCFKEASARLPFIAGDLGRGVQP